MRRRAGLVLGAILLACGSPYSSESGGDGSGARDAGGGGADAGGGGGDGGTPTGPDGSAALASSVNAIVRPGAGPTDAPLPLYPVRRVGAGASAAAGIAFAYDGAVLEALDQDGRSLWKKDVGAGALFGGFDIDGDGVVDLGLVRAKELPTDCFGKKLHERAIDLVLGGTGTILPANVPALSDICWSFGYATEQWSVLAALFGAGSRDLVLVPQYTSTNENALNAYSEGKAFVVGLEGGAMVLRGSMTMPTVPAYDALPGAKPEPHGSGTAYYAASHVPNGLVTGDGAGARLLFFTSGRAVSYGMKAPFALAADLPWLTAGRADLLGRNYGLVMPDPARPARVALVAGASTVSLWQDMVSGKMESDPWAGIERHVAIYDADTNTVDDRFFSYAHDGGDAMKYEGRTVHPNAAWVGARGAPESRLVFDVYQGGHWHTIVTKPGTTTSDVDLRDLFVWDVRDLDGDGEPEIIASPARDPADPDVPGYYFVKARTIVHHWDEAGRALTPIKTYPEGLPWLVGGFRDTSRSSSGGWLYPVLAVATDTGRALVLRAPDGSRKLAAYP